jgi:hypothetical protein
MTNMVYNNVGDADGWTNGADGVNFYCGLNGNYQAFRSLVNGADQFTPINIIDLVLPANSLSIIQVGASFSSGVGSPGHLLSIEDSASADFTLTLI